MVWDRIECIHVSWLGSGGLEAARASCRCRVTVGVVIVMIDLVEVEGFVARALLAVPGWQCLGGGSC